MLENGRCARRRVGGVSEVVGRDLRSDELHAVLEARGIAVFGADFFEEETDVLSSSGDAGPVNQLVRGIFGALLTLGCWLRGGHDS